MELYGVKLRVETITANARLNDNIYGGWKAINIGSAPVTVYGVELLPGEGLDFMAGMQPNEIWQEPIEITVQAGGAVRLMRKIVTPIMAKTIGGKIKRS